jgi:hypothetical protein
MKLTKVAGIVCGILVSPVDAFACGDLDVVCRAQEAIDPDCRGDLCKVVRPVNREADRLVNNVANGIENAPGAIQECLSDVGQCVQNILSTPLAAAQLAWLESLNRQAEGRLYNFSPQFINLTQQYYDVDLRGVTWAEGIDTHIGSTVAICDRIFFTEVGGNVWQDKNELWLTLHEMEHLGQCQRRGRNVFLAEYILKGLVQIPQGFTNIHDNIDMEAAANRKADELTDMLWQQIRSGAVPVPGPTASTTTASPVVTFPVRFCQTPAGACQIPPAMLPMGTPCYCADAYGNVINGSAF